jgi:hypothetical protein
LETIAGTSTLKATTPSGVSATLPWVNLAKYAAVGVGLAQGTEIQAALTAAAGGVLMIPPGTWDLGTTAVTFACSIDMKPGATLTYSGSATALKCDNYDDVVIRGLNLQRDTLGWFTGADVTSIGLQIYNSNRPKVYDPTIRNFWRGLNLHGDADGTSYGDIYLPELNDNMINFSCTAVAAGWANSNNVFGGRIRINSGNAGAVGSRYIELVTAGNGTNFFGTSLEDDNVELTADISKTFVTMFGCRLEQASGIRLNAGGHYFQLIGGYGNSGPDPNPASSGVPITHNGGEGDIIISGFGSQFSSDGGAVGAGLGVVFAATNAPANILRTMKDDAGLIRAEEDAQGVIRLYRVPGKGGAVQPEASVMLDGPNRKVWLGDGTATPASYFVGTSPTRCDFGPIGNTFRTLGPIEIDGALDHDGTTVGFYGTTPVTVPTSVSPRAALQALGLGVTLLVTRTGTATGNAATPSINTDNVDNFVITGLNTAITSMTTNLTGTPTNGQRLHIAITGTASRAITWGASWEASTVALPTTTSGTARLDVDFIWNAATPAWRCLQVA